MVNQYKICYTAKWPDGKLLDPKKPFMDAYILASTKNEAAAKLISEFPGLHVTIANEPEIVQEQSDED